MKTKQQIFDCFYSQLNGKGRAVASSNGPCRYFVEGHPGCAIGCQPEFREEAKARGIEGSDLNGLASINVTAEINDICENAFPNIRLNFLCDLQRFHDNSVNWDGDFLVSGEVRNFCQRNGLISPV